MKIMPMPIPLQIPENNVQKPNVGGVDFGNILNNAIDRLNTAEVKAEKVMEKFMVGEVQDIHQVTIAMQEAKLTMQLAVEVRNKIVETYQEISRMQI